MYKLLLNKLTTMKNILLITFLMLFTFEVFSQDVLLKRSGDQLEVKVTEVSDDYIKYKKKGFHTLSQ